MDNQLEIVASADLTPESPKPINPSSPVVVPALQDQADNLTMLLSPDHPPSAASSVSAAEPQDFANPGAEMPNQGLTDLGNKDTTEDLVEPQVAGNDYGKNVEAPAVEAVVANQHDVSKSNESRYSTDASEPLKNLSTMEAASDGTSSSSKATNLVQSLAEPISTSASKPNPSLQADAGTQIQTEPTSTTNQAGPREATSTEPTIDTETKGAAADTNDTSDAIDIQALVDNITARAVASESNKIGAAATSENGTNPSQSANAPSSSLPPRPPMSQQPTPSYMRPEDLRKFQPGTSLPNGPATYPGMPTAASVPYPYPAPGTIPENPGSFQPPPPVMNAHPSVPQNEPYQMSQGFGVPNVPIDINSQQNFNSQQRFDAFLQEERKYVSEAKWDRFPDGSRLFIGNLSSERVAKREVFDIFSKYGRLAQISLKQAYGFVQYHTPVEGQAAMDNLQGIEIKGRKIHLEFSRAQKKDNDGDRNRGNRGRGGNNNNNNNNNDRDRFDGRRRDDYRSRSASPGHDNNQRQGSYGRDRGHRLQNSSGRSRNGRSRSPPVYGGDYRRRSPSPYRRGPTTSEADLDIPKRYASDVPDVQLLLLQEVDRDFVSWVQRQFLDRGLKVDVMFLNPVYPRDLVIQRQVVEGVHAVSELDYRAQQFGKIPLQVFDRSAGRHNARFDQYQDLDPTVAAELVARTKSQYQLQAPAGYGNNPYPPAAYHPPPAHPPQPYPGQPPVNPALGALGNLGSLDNATLQKVLGVIQGAPQGAGSGHPMAPNSGVDMNALLGALGPNNGGVPGPPMPHQPMAYPHPHAPGPNGAPGNPADSQHVQNIMSQLARFK